MVVQQMLVLPYHPSDPAPLPFHVSHVILAATRSVVLEDERYGLKFFRPASKSDPSYKPPTTRKGIMRSVLESTFDPEWLQANGAYLDAMVERGSNARSAVAQIPAKRHASESYF